VIECILRQNKLEQLVARVENHVVIFLNTHPMSKDIYNKNKTFLT